MKKIGWLFMVLVALSLVGSGCKSEKGTVEKDTSKVLATVNNENITENDLLAEVGGKPENFQRMASTPEGRRMMTERLVERRLLMQKAEAQGLTNSPILEKKLNVYKERLVVEELRKQVMGRPNPTNDQDLQKYYEEHKVQFSTPEMARVRRIILSDKAAAEKVQKELKANPGQFMDIAKSVSQDDFTRNRGGDMGFVMKMSDAQVRVRNSDPASLQRSTIPDALADAVFALNQNEISPVLESDGKYYIYQMQEKRPADEKKFDELKDQIKRAMEFEGSQTKWKEYVDGLKKDAKIEYKIDTPGKNEPGKSDLNKEPPSPAPDK